MQNFLNLLIGGAVAGGLYAILASGVVLTYRTSGIFNFAHGAVAFATAFFFVELNKGGGLPIAVSAVLALVIFAPLLGLLLDRMIFRHLGHASETVRLVVPIALLIAVPGACLLVVDRLDAWFHLRLPTISGILVVPGLGPTPPHTWRAGRIIFDSNELIILASVVVVVGALWIVLRRTRLGLLMRAVVDRRALASIRGVDPNLTSSVSWMMGGFLAGLGGVLLAPVFGLDPSTFTAVVLISTPAVVLARFVSLPIAVAGGLLIGVVQNLVIGYANFAQSITGFRTAVPYMLLFLVLMVLGVNRQRRGDVKAETSTFMARARDENRHGALLTWGLLAVALLVYVYVFASGFWAGIMAQGLALGLVMLSFTIVTGLGGMVSLAQPAFVTGAGFTAGWILSHGLPFPLALLAGTAVAAVLGLLVSLPTLRLGGLPLALATMALAFIAEDLVFQLPAVSNADNGGWSMAPPKFGPLNLQNPRTMVVCLMVVLAIAALLVKNLIRSSSGRAMASLRGSGTGAVTVGVAAARTRMAIFVCSAALAGFGGVLLAMTVGQVSNTDYPVEIGLFWLATVVVVGVRYPTAALIAGISSAVLPQILVHLSPVAYLPETVSGLAVLTLAKNQDGIFGLVSQGRAERASRRARAMMARARGPERGPVAAPARVAPATIESGARAQVLVLDGICACYGDAIVLRGVDLAISAGEVVAVVGANGAGKSTMCSVVAGLLSPTTGRIWLRGEPVDDTAAHRRVSGGVFLIPEGRGIFPSLTTEDNLRVWLRDSLEIEHVYERFPILAQRRFQAAALLSGGEQQMLALAPALARPPALLVVDEPSLGLAPMVTRQVYASLAEARDRGAAILLVEEKARDILSLADRVVFMSTGKILWDRPATEVDEALLVDSYLGIATPSDVRAGSGVGAREDRTHRAAEKV